MTRLGYQIPNFTYPGSRPEEIFDKVVVQARAAEAAGYDRVLLMDHFYQLPGLGAPDEPMFECYSMLSALAQHPENPAMPAKTVTTLDHVSRGRATLGIGAGWFEAEHIGYGFEFGTLGERFKKLDEALSIIAPMLRKERPTVEGKFYTAMGAINEPAPLSKIPIMIGGQGEKKTLRLVAKYADESNLTGSVADIPRKLEALARHCEDLGRDRSEIVVTKLMMIAVAPTMEEVEADFRAIAEVKRWDSVTAEMARQALIFGDADTVGEQITDAVNLGLDGVTVDLPVNGDNPERVALLAEIALKALE